MPTSHNLILYTLATAGIASVSVLNMMLACVVPALSLTVLNLLAAYGVAIKRGYPTRGVFPGWGEVFNSFVAALPGLLIVVIILAGILSACIHGNRVSGHCRALGAVDHYSCLPVLVVE